MHSLDDNKALVRRAIGYNHGAADEGDEICAADFVAYMPGQAPMDRATFEHFVGGVTNGTPGYTYEIHDQIAHRVTSSRTGSPGGASTQAVSQASPRPVDRIARHQHV